ncbi:HAMP domain-containing sensor histidine kinase [Proteiniborus sp. MB09-C3]|uniref:sensor histidine kinase n=1 Tax=Proteiniborus sp. MB09-C3 TaxID=3050072 RepID=UPI002556C57D|nr:HAMP domain-containing sensor histidine kinase [Proteiniborus sp. MB09-C3]WIV12652.1 HAMP domain-containing sensor histidine kinase [Proteiniborus sp. MB09-C3]
MEILIIIFIIAIAGIFAILYFLSMKEIKGITYQLDNINGTDTNSKILIYSPNKAIEKLAIEINKTLEEKQKSEIEHKRMDMELRQAIANMSHDLRTPLTSIMGYIQLIEDDSLSSNEKKEYTDIIKRRAKSLQTLISSFYDLSRLEAKEYKFELSSLNLKNILYDLMASFYKDFSSNNIEPVINVDEKAYLVIADENAVRRIFSNLIQNALKYGNSFVSISLKNHKDYVVTTFTNDAPDLSEEDASHLFERFFTVDRTRSRKSTGLGLAITKQLVEQMGHKIFVELCDSKLSIIIKWKVKSNIKG